MIVAAAGAGLVRAVYFLRRRWSVESPESTESPEESGASTGARLKIWFSCSLLAAVIPLGFVWYVRAQEPKTPAGIVDVLGGGDLIIISVVLIIGALGTLIEGLLGQRFGGWDGGFIVFGVLVGLFAAMLYGNNVCFNCEAQHLVRTQHPGWVAVGSGVVFISSVIVGAGSIIRGGGRRGQ